MLECGVSNDDKLIVTWKYLSNTFTGELSLQVSCYYRCIVTTGELSLMLIMLLMLLRCTGVLPEL